MQHEASGLERTSDGSIKISTNDHLRELRLGGLREVAGSLVVESNVEMTKLIFPVPTASWQVQDHITVMANLMLPCEQATNSNLTGKVSSADQVMVFGCNGTVPVLTTCPGLVLSEAVVPLFEGCTRIAGDLKIDATSDIVSLDHAALAGIVAYVKSTSF